MIHHVAGSKLGAQNGTLEKKGPRAKTCGPYPGGLILTHTHVAVGLNPNRTPSEHPVQSNR